ncbi:hypothetical protein [Rothia nasisuis]|uniref:hypothetical protein n=1 Tax=Rothia nasisuis TaxID=2109647 RepID=UPI001F28E636|nr:hypothetical protein [Rothia nasisuis]
MHGVSSLDGGGAGFNISVELEQLGPLADALQGVADRYEDLVGPLGSLTAQVALLAPLDSSGAGAGALATLGAGTVALYALVEGVSRLAGRVRLSARAYEQAERFAVEALSAYAAAERSGSAAARQVGSVFGYRVGTLKIRVVHGAQAVVTATEKGYLLFRQTRLGHEFFNCVTGVAARKARQAGMNGRLRSSKDMTGVLMGPGSERGYMMAPPTTAQAITEMFEQAQAIEEAGDAHMEAQGHQHESDHVTVQTYVHEHTGEVSYLVIVPGTDGEMSWREQYDGGVNNWVGTVLMAEALKEPNLAPEEYPALMTLVQQAMDDAGIPEGAKVNFAGFSQGGMAAMAMANNGSVASRYRVGLVITIGTPVHGVRARDGVKHVDITYQGDPVAHLLGDDPDYRPHHSHVLRTRPEGAGAHGASDYRKMAEIDPGAQQTIQELEEVFSGYQWQSTNVTSGSTHLPTVTDTEQEQMMLLGTANLVHATAQEAGAGSRHLSSEDINPSDIYQDIDHAMRQFDANAMRPADQWLDEQLRRVEIGGVQLHNPTFEGFTVGEPAPLPPEDPSIRVYHPDLQQHVRNMSDLAGLGGLVSDEAIDQGVTEAVHFFAPEDSVPAG